MLDEIVAHADFASFSAWLRSPGPWLAAFDFPFGLPRALVETLGWPREWLPLARHYTGLSRAEIRATFQAFCAARPIGNKFAHRACDAFSTASPSMKWVNPPVAFMLHAGHRPAARRRRADRDAASGRSVDGSRSRAIPGLLARELIGRRSYKSDTRAMQTPARREARVELLRRLEAGESRLGLALALDAAQREALLDDGSADRLDAVLCLMQAAWAAARPGWGLPDDVDPLEGWIVSAVR